MNDLRERFSSLDRRLADLGMPDLLQAAEQAPDHPGVGLRPRQRRHLLVPALAALLVASLTGAAWAIYESSVKDTVSVDCEIRGSSTVIPSASGDPIVDCSAEWQRQTGSAAPKLAAYDTGIGSIAVLPTTQTPPSGWKLLPEGEAQSADIVEMQQWLDDYVSGLNSGCYRDASAVQMTQATLQRLGMTGWTVQPPPSADNPGSCVDSGILDPSTQTVQLRAFNDAPPPDATFTKLAVKLRAIVSQCQDADAAVREVRAAANDLGLSESSNQYELTVVPDNGASCTRIYEDVGGTIFVIVRGPTR
jgi:hypothetical protein